jgi:hypothetical protein
MNSLRLTGAVVSSSVRTWLRQLGLYMSRCHPGLVLLDGLRDHQRIPVAPSRVPAQVSDVPSAVADMCWADLGRNALVAVA